MDAAAAESSGSTTWTGIVGGLVSICCVYLIIYLRQERDKAHEEAKDAVEKYKKAKDKNKKGGDKV